MFELILTQGVPLVTNAATFVKDVTDGKPNS
jgi:hypothetical protein